MTETSADDPTPPARPGPRRLGLVDHNLLRAHLADDGLEATS